MPLKFGYIGLGLMGRPIALNLIKAGNDIAVYARREVSMQPLVDAGAIPYSSPAQLAQDCDIIFTNVSETKDVEEVVLGDQGIIEGAHPDSIVIDMSTISPLATRNIAARLKEKAIHMLDAPVSGGTQGAMDATLSIMVGGDKETFSKVLPVLQSIGKNIVHVGGHGAGQIAKACNQLVVAQTVAAIGEAFILARAAGVDPARVREALLGGFAGSKILQIHGQRMLDENYTPGFKARLHQKDMGIVQETAAALGLKLPGTGMTSSYIDELVAEGLGEIDSAALVKQLEAHNKIRIKVDD
jgi:2-hydroxy-3-oxopropionate reductase